MRAEERRIKAAIMGMYAAWRTYASAYADYFSEDGEPGRPIGEDYVLGDDWKAIGLGIRGLLNGPTGDIECGLLDGMLLHAMAASGLDVSEL